MHRSVPEDGGRRASGPDYSREILKKHVLGAFLRSTAGGVIWACAFLAYELGAFERQSFIKASLALAILPVVNVPILWIARYAKSKIFHELIFMTTHAVEVMAYTAFIYFVGGIEASFLATIFIALIFFIGVVAPVRYPFIIAGMCSLAFITMGVLEHLGFIPHQNTDFWQENPHLKIAMVLTVVTAIFFIIATMSAYAGRMLSNARTSLERKNQDLKTANRNLLREVEDRVQAESALRKSEQKLQRIFNNIPDAIFIHDMEGNLLEINEGFRASFGYSGPAPRPLTVNIKDFMPEKYRPLFDSYVSDFVHKGKDEGFIRLVARDGSERVYEYRNSLITDDRGGALSVQGVARDVTERLDSEREKRRLQERLQRAQKMEALGLLAGGVAHDLNNLLSGIVSYPDFLLMGLPEDSHMRKALSTIKLSGEKAASIVQDLLTLARRGVSVSQVVNVNRIIVDYLSSPEYGHLLSVHPDTVVDIHLDPGLMNTMGSPVHLLKSIMNLVTNAAESMPDGGVITISTENRTLERPVTGYETVERGDYVVLTIQDKGVGLSEEDHQRIFEPFYTKKAMGRSGTGLGLSVVWGTVQDHKGYIEVRSELGKGAAFTVYLPATREAVAGEDKPVPVEPCRGRGETILVVDDMEAQRVITTRILEGLGYRVDSVSSGEEAVVRLRDNGVDLLLIDMIMDGIDGLETYKQVLEVHPEQRAIIVSGYSETDRVKEALSLGASAYIRKPYTLQKIASAIREALA